ncbi:UNVERIFIED_CONTAM: hypothetical protein DES50_11482 [Williamsia faeni]
MTTPAAPAAPTDDRLVYRLPASHRRDWRLFTDWCTAFDTAPLPASPVTIARFLDFEPGRTRGTLRRRVSAINAAHRIAGHTPPGTRTAVRGLLSARDRHTETARQVIARLPVSGWPAGLFGRRDALVLTLVCGLGIPLGRVGQLRCGDITVDVAGSVLHIGGGHDITAQLEADNPYGAYAVFSRWATVRDLTLRRPSPMAWAPALHTAPTRAEVPEVSWHEHYDPDAALLPTFDRWGNPTAPIGHTTTGLSARAATAILHTHLRAPGRPITARTAWTSGVLERRARPLEPDPTPVAVPELGDTYDDGVDARRRAAAELDDLDEVFDALDHQMTALLARTEQLLDDTD